MKPQRIHTWISTDGRENGLVCLLHVVLT